MSARALPPESLAPGAAGAAYEKLGEWIKAAEAYDKAAAGSLGHTNAALMEARAARCREKATPEQKAKARIAAVFAELEKRGARRYFTLTKKAEYGLSKWEIELIAYEVRGKLFYVQIEPHDGSWNIFTPVSDNSGIVETWAALDKWLVLP